MSSARSLKGLKRIRFAPRSVAEAVMIHKRLVRADVPLFDTSRVLRNWRKRVES